MKIKHIFFVYRKVWYLRINMTTVTYHLKTIFLTKMTLFCPFVRNLLSSSQFWIWVQTNVLLWTYVLSCDCSRRSRFPLVRKLALWMPFLIITVYHRVLKTQDSKDSLRYQGTLLLSCQNGRGSPMTTSDTLMRWWEASQLNEQLL